MAYKQRQTGNDWPIARSAASILVFLIFIALSYLTYGYMASAGYSLWYQVLIPVAVEWLAFVGLMKLTWSDY